MEAKPEVIQGLNVTAQMLANLSAQYRVYKINLSKFGLKWLSKKIGKKYCCCEGQLDIVLCRIFYYGEDPEYNVGSVAGATKVTEILTHCGQMVKATLDHAIEQRVSSYQAMADYTTDIYEHLIEDLEKHEYFIQQQLGLIAMMGEAAYVGARLEDC